MSTPFQKEVAKQRKKSSATGAHFLVVGDKRGNVLKGKARDKALLSMGCEITKIKIDEP